MNELSFNSKVVNNKALIIILCAISFVGVLFSKTIFFIYDLINYYNEYTFSISSIIYILEFVLSLFFVLLPCLLLVLYVLFLYKKFSARFILAIVFLSLAFPIASSVLRVLSTALSVYEIGYLDMLTIFGVFAREFVKRCLTCIPLLLSSVLVIFGVKNKILHVFTLGFSLFSYIYFFMQWLVNLIPDFYELSDWFGNICSQWSYYLGDPIWRLSSITITIAVMVFVVSDNELISKKLK